MNKIVLNWYVKIIKVRVFVTKPKWAQSLFSSKSRQLDDITSSDSLFYGS